MILLFQRFESGIRTWLHVTVEVAVFMHERKASQDLESHIANFGLVERAPSLLHQLIQVAFL